MTLDTDDMALLELARIEAILMVVMETMDHDRDEHVFFTLASVVDQVKNVVGYIHSTQGQR